MPMTTTASENELGMQLLEAYVETACHSLNEIRGILF